jgi:hypothetical protein
MVGAARPHGGHAGEPNSDDGQDVHHDHDQGKLRAFVASQPGDWQIVAVYSDDASGASTDRPNLQTALRAARAGLFDTLLVYRVDRFSRSLRDLTGLLDDLADAGVVFRSATEPFDTSTPVGRMLVQMLGVFADQRPGPARPHRRPTQRPQGHVRGPHPRDHDHLRPDGQAGLQLPLDGNDEGLALQGPAPTSDTANQTARALPTMVEPHWVRTSKCPDRRRAAGCPGRGYGVRQSDHGTWACGSGSGAGTSGRVVLCRIYDA